MMPRTLVASVLLVPTLVVFNSACSFHKSGKNITPSFKVWETEQPLPAPPVSFSVNGCALALAGAAMIEARSALGVQSWKGALDFEVGNPTPMPVGVFSFGGHIELEGSSGRRYRPHVQNENKSGWTVQRGGGGEATLAPGARARLRLWVSMGEGPASDPLVAFHHAGVRYPLE